jgi:hypothetical protein
VPSRPENPGWHGIGDDPGVQVYWDGRGWTAGRRFDGASWTDAPMSSIAPGWWQASDGRWYPPALHPSVLASSSPASPGPAPSSSSDRRPGPRRHRLALVSAVVGLVVVTVVSLVVALSGPAVTLTLQEVSEAYQATWPGFAQGFAHENLATMRKYTTPEMVQAVIGAYGCGCAPWPARSPTVRFSFPTEHHYPLSFLAEIPGNDFDGSPLGREVVFSQADISAPWRVTYMVAFSGTRSYLGPSALRSPPRMRFNVTIVGGQFASFFQTVVNTGVPAPDNNWPQTGSVKDEVDRYLQTKEAIEQIGDAQHMTFAPADHSIAFAAPAGDIMCGVIRSSALVTTPPGVPTVQPADRSLWGTHLAPGSYTTLTKSGTHDYCFIARRSGLTSPISFFGGTYQIVGRPG